MINPNIIAQKTPQTRRKTTPSTSRIGVEILDFFFSTTAPVLGAAGVSFGVDTVPLNANEFPSFIARAGVLLRACSAGVG